MGDYINIHVYPHALTPEDTLVDGPDGKKFEIADHTLLVWVDLHPDAKFTHPTAYVLMSAAGIQVEEGGWWPVLNGKPILYGSRNKLAVISPFELISTAEA